MNRIHIIYAVLVVAGMSAANVRGYTPAGLWAAKQTTNRGVAPYSGGSTRSSGGGFWSGGRSSGGSSWGGGSSYGGSSYDSGSSWGGYRGSGSSYHK